VDRVIPIMNLTKLFLHEGVKKKNYTSQSVLKHS